MVVSLDGQARFLVEFTFLAPQCQISVDHPPRENNDVF